MRLSPELRQQIRQWTAELFGPTAKVYLFGSRVDDQALGGDIDLMVDLNQPRPGVVDLQARLGARVSRASQGRRVDVVVSAPDLAALPIHEIARREGVML